jgi:hypothetical protein
MTWPYEYEIGKQKKTAAGNDLATPDIDTGNLLIEVYLRTEPQHAGSVIVSKLKGSGYQLAVNRAGSVTLTLQAGAAKAEVAAGATISDGQWHHVIAEVDRAGKNARLYVDGKKAAQDDLALPAEASLSNEGDLLVGRNADGCFFAGALEFLRIARGTLQEARTSIEELYDWEFDGPFLRDFCGAAPTGKCRAAGAFETPR